MNVKMREFFALALGLGAAWVLCPIVSNQEVVCASQLDSPESMEESSDYDFSDKQLHSHHLKSYYDELLANDQIQFIVTTEETFVDQMDGQVMDSAYLAQNQQVTHALRTAGYKGEFIAFAVEDAEAGGPAIKNVLLIDRTSYLQPETYDTFAYYYDPTTYHLDVEHPLDVDVALDYLPLDEEDVYAAYFLKNLQTGNYVITQKKLEPHADIHKSADHKVGFRFLNSNHLEDMEMPFTPEMSGGAENPAVNEFLSHCNLPEGTKTYSLDFDYDGMLPGDAELTLDLSDSNFTPDSILYLYYCSTELFGSLEVPTCVFDEGLAQFPISHCCEYVVTDQPITLKASTSPAPEPSASDPNPSGPNPSPNEPDQRQPGQKKPGQTNPSQPEQTQPEKVQPAPDDSNKIDQPGDNNDQTTVDQVTPRPASTSENPRVTKIERQGETTGVPKTGDATEVLVWIVLFLLGGITELMMWAKGEFKFVENSKLVN